MHKLDYDQEHNDQEVSFLHFLSFRYLENNCIRVLTPRFQLHLYALKTKHENLVEVAGGFASPGAKLTIFRHLALPRVHVRAALAAGVP